MHIHGPSPFVRCVEPWAATAKRRAMQCASDGGVRQASLHAFVRERGDVVAGGTVLKRVQATRVTRSASAFSPRSRQRQGPSLGSGRRGVTDSAGAHPPLPPSTSEAVADDFSQTASASVAAIAFVVVAFAVAFVDSLVLAVGAEAAPRRMQSKQEGVHQWRRFRDALNLACPIEQAVPEERRKAQQTKRLLTAPCRCSRWDRRTQLQGENQGCLCWREVRSNDTERSVLHYGPFKSKIKQRGVYVAPYCIWVRSKKKSIITSTNTCRLTGAI